MNATLITSNLFIGTYPRDKDDLNRLKSGPKITAVLNLQTDGDMRALKVNWPELEQAYRALDMTCRRWPIVDFSSTDLERRLEGAVDLLDQLVEAGHRVYVHCTAGTRRSPAVVIGYLTWHQGMSLKGAIRLVKRLRPCAPLVSSIFAVHVSRTF